jgi:hypothetical protein
MAFRVISTGDGEGGIEMTESMLLIKGYCDILIPPEKITRTRIVKFHSTEQFVVSVLQILL